MASTSKSKTSTSSGQNTTTEAIVAGTTGDDTFYMVDTKYRGLYSQVGASVTIDGGNGKDIIYGRNASEVIRGGSGSDWINGGGGNDTMDGGGGTGVDWLSFQPYKYGDPKVTYNAYASGVTVSLKDQTFSYDAFGGYFSGIAKNFENVYGSDGDDVITGDASANEIRAGNRDDLVIGREGNDVLYGDAGDDTIVGGTWSPGEGSGVLTQDQMRGTGNDNNVMFGGAGNDLLVSAVGNDWIDGGDGTDVVDYSYLPEGFNVRVALLPGGQWTKATVYTVVDGNEVVYENDWIRNVEGLRGGLSDDTITGDPTKDNRIEAGPGNDTLYGGSKNDYLDGGANDDVIDSGDGDDTIDGGTGNDSVSGGNGQDLLLGGGGGNDSFDGGAGNDTISFAPVRGRNYDPCEEVALDTRSLVIDLARGEYSWRQEPTSAIWSGTVTGIENAIGSHCSDEITGDDGSNVLDGGDGDDILRGRGGDDTLRGGKGNDWASFQNPVLSAQQHYDNEPGAGAAPAPASAPALMPMMLSLVSPASDDAPSEEVDAYSGGVIADLSSHGGWYAYRDQIIDPADPNRLELTGTENLHGSAGSDDLTGDAVAYVVLADAMSTLGTGDRIRFTFEGKAYTATIGPLGSGTLASALQAAIDDAMSIEATPVRLGEGKVFADSVNSGADLRLRAVDATTGAAGSVAAVTLTDGVYVDAKSGIESRDFMDSGSYYLAFDKLVPQLSDGDEFTFTVAGVTKTVALDLAGLKLYADLGYSAADEAALVAALNSALSGTGVTADIVNGVHVLFRATSELKLGTFANCIFSEDTAAALDNLILGEAGNDTIRGGAGKDTIEGGTGRDSIDGGDGDDVVNGDGGSVIVFSGVVPGLSAGDTLRLTYNGVTYELELEDDGVEGVQAALDDLFVREGVRLNAFSPDGSDLQLRMLEWTHTVSGVAVANTLSAVYTDADSAVQAVESPDDDEYLLTFADILTRLSAGDQFTFTVGTSEHTITVGRVPPGATSTDYLALINAALEAEDLDSTVNASIVDGTGIEFRSGIELLDGTFTDQTASAGTGGNDTILGGFGDDTILGGASGYDLSKSGLGGNRVTGGPGSDTFKVGFLGDGTAVDGTDFITDWDDQAAGTGVASGRDSLFVSAKGTAIIGGLAGKAGWDGSDLVDLRSQVTNDGKIIVFTGLGDDTFYGSSGKDWIFAGAGLNNIDLSAGGADRVFIDTYLGKYNVTGFSGDDKLYINRAVIDAFAPSSLLSWPLLVSDIGGTVTFGQAYNSDQMISPLSELIYDRIYSSILAGVSGYVPGSPLNFAWQSNGAWNNFAHTGADITSDLTLIGAGIAQIAVGYPLLGIPFIGPIIGGLLIASGGLNIYDALAFSAKHINTTYNNDGGLTALVNLMYSAEGDRPSSTVGTWDARQFLDFYRTPADQFAATLEIADHPNDQGIYTIATLYNGTETFVYMVFSEDGLIQNNETRLIAQVNGYVSANQIVLYDNNTAEIRPYVDPVNPPAPVFAAKVNSVALVDDSSAKAHLGLTTADKTPTITVVFSQAIVRTGADADTIVVKFNGVAITDISWSAGNTTATFTVPDLNQLTVDGRYAVSVGVTNAQGFESNFSTQIRLDTQAPKVEAYGIIGSSAGVTINATEAGFVRFLTAGTPDTLETPGTPDTPVKLDSADGETTADVNGWLALGAGNSVTAAVTEQGTLTWIDKYELKDAVGNTRSVTSGSPLITYEADGTTELVRSIAPKIGLGTSVGEAISGAGAVPVALFGFGGNDTLTGSGVDDVLMGGDGDDSIIGGAGADFVAGGAGEDTIDLTEIVVKSDQVMVSAVISSDINVASTSDSGPDAPDAVTGFGSEDVLVVVGSGVSKFNHADDAKAAPIASTTDTALTFELTGDSTLGAGDIKVVFKESSPALTQVRYELTGTDGDDTLTGGLLDDRLAGGQGDDSLSGAAGDDTLIGGAGRDTLAGGTGKDTFAFAAGDSTATAADCDVISDLDLVAGDKIDLSAIAPTLALIVEEDAPFTALSGTGSPTFTSGFDAFLYKNLEGAYYLVYETEASGATSTDPGDYEMVRLIGMSDDLTGWSASAGVISYTAPALPPT